MTPWLKPRGDQSLGGCVNLLLPSCEFVPFNPYCASVLRGRMVCAADLHAAGRQGTQEGTATCRGCTPRTTHTRHADLLTGWTCTRRFPLVETQSGDLQSDTENQCRNPLRASAAGRPRPRPTPTPAQGPHLRLQLGPSPRPTPGPGIRPFSTAHSLVRGPGPPCGPSKWPPLECDPRTSSVGAPDPWAAGHYFLLLLSLFLYLAAERGACP